MRQPQAVHRGDRLEALRARPARLPDSAADGAIGTTGTAMQQEMNELGTGRRGAPRQAAEWAPPPGDPTPCDGQAVDTLSGDGANTRP